MEQIKVSMENSAINLKTENGTYCLSKEEARVLASSLMAAAEGHEDYLSLKKGDTVYHANVKSGNVERGVIYSIHTTTVRVIQIDKKRTRRTVIERFCVEYPDINDFDELKGECLGKTVFVGRKNAEDALIKMRDDTDSVNGEEAVVGFNFYAVYDKEDEIRDMVPLISREQMLFILRENDASGLFETNPFTTTLSLKNNGISSFPRYIKPLYVMESGYARIAAEMSAKRNEATGHITPVVKYGCSYKDDRNNPWRLDGWLDSHMEKEHARCHVNFSMDDWEEQLRKEMKKNLILYCEINNYKRTRPVNFS